MNDAYAITNVEHDMMTLNNTLMRPTHLINNDCLHNYCKDMRLLPRKYHRLRKHHLRP